MYQPYVKCGSTRNMYSSRYELSMKKTKIPPESSRKRVVGCSGDRLKQRKRRRGGGRGGGGSGGRKGGGGVWVGEVVVWWC